MKSIDIAGRNLLKTAAGFQFLPIGNPEKLFGDGGFLDQVKDRIFKKNNAPVTDFWATLGRQDGQAIDWTGTIDCSRNGNDRSTGLTGEQVDELRQLHPEIDSGAKRALERFISFDKIKFGNSEASRKIRLTVMVGTGEGAIAFLQHTDRSDTKSQSGTQEYILPEATEGNATNTRDRLTYQFDVPPLGPNDRFVIKFITFTRSGTDSKSIVSRFENPYKLLRFNNNANAFEQVNSGIPAADRTKKTLLLIHGTFSTTNKSYKGFLDSGWLNKAINTKTYDQILALDHPTVFEDARQNVDKLVSLVGSGPKFSQPLHIITTSRGGLVGKTIVNDANIHANLFTVERMAAVACANGVEHFTAGWKIAKFLSVLKTVFKLTGAGNLSLITALAENSAEFILKQPGCVLMTPGSDRLKTVLGGIPQNPGMRYLPVTGDYKPDDLKDKVIDLLVKAVYKNDPNDWVVGTKQQAIMPDANYAYRQTLGRDYNYYLSNTYDCTHTTYLTSKLAPPDPKQYILDYLTAAYSGIL